MSAAALRPPEVVCIAASTGGPQAVGALLDAFTAPPPCPVLVVQHMPGTFTGRFALRLDRASALPVHEAVSGDRLRAGEVLVAPGDLHLRIRSGRVRLTREPPVAGLRPRADVTLADLADGYGEGATAVVLSGMGSDGLEGAVAVAGAGGQVLAQDAASSTVDGMPARIRAAGLADLVGPPDVLGAAMDRAWRRTGRPARTAAPRRGARPPRGVATAFDPPTERVAALLRRLEAIDLRSFKPAQIERNLRSFADQHGYDLDELVTPLERDPRLRQALLDRVAINVTSFFRDPDRWAELVRFVVPHLGPRPTVWNPGCADGSETLSLAMVLAESGRRPRIWATDVNGARITAARTARYAESAVAGLPAVTAAVRDAGRHHRAGAGAGTEPGAGAANGSDGGATGDRRDRWFRAGSGGWVARDELRGLITYDRHDAVADDLAGPVPAPFDLVVCRNLIIYLTPEGRDRLLDRIAGALAPDGAVLLGNAERVLRPERYGLRRVGPGLYRRTGPATSAGAGA